MPDILGGTPWGAVAQGVLGIGESIINAGKAHRAQRQLETMIDNYQPNQSIMDYYNKALSRYNSNPYTSSLYNQQKENIARSTAQGIAALGDRRSALAGIPALVQNQNDSMLKAAAAAEGQQGQQLSQLGQATAAKAAEDKYKFEGKYNLLSMKAGAANQGVNAGIQNIFGGLNGIQDYQNINNTYGNRRSTKTYPIAGADGSGGY